MEVTASPCDLHQESSNLPNNSAAFFQLTLSVGVVTKEIYRSRVIHGLSASMDRVSRQE